MHVRGHDSFAENQLYFQMFQVISNALGMIDRQGRWIDVNPALCRLVGYEKHEVIGKCCDELPMRLSAEKNAFRFEQTLRRKLPVYRSKIECCRKDGAPLSLDFVMTPLPGTRGRSQRFLIQLDRLQDELTMQNKLRQMERESEKTFSALMEHTLEPFVAVRDERCVYANGAGLQLLGAFTKEELVGRRIEQFVDSDNARLLEEKLMQTKQGVIDGPMELRIHRLDGQAVDAQVVAIPAMFGGEPSIHLLIRDITERKRTEEAFRMSDKLKAVGEMAAGLAHEIRNPLTAIKGFVQLAEWQLQAKNEYFSIIKEEIERIDSITSEMLMLAKPNPSKMRIADLRTILKAVSTLLETQAIMSNIEIVCEFPDSPGWVECDENQIKQVFVNLIKNAIEAMKSGGRITVTTSRDRGLVCAKVIDEGCGIPGELLGKIGQPFYTTKDKGTGLGLMVSYKIIENHRGSITVSSVENAGTTFCVRLPYAKPK